MNKRYKNAKKISFLSLLANIFLLIIKLVVGVLSNSQSMIGDALNSGGDIFSSMLSYVGNKIALKPRDDEHNLGYGKAEYIYAILIAVVMIYIAFKLFISSLKSLIWPNNYLFSWYLILVCLITILVKLILFFYTKKEEAKNHNILLKAAMNDHRNDIFLTLLNLVACLFSYYKITIIDSLVGTFIAIWIFYTAYKIYKEAYFILMDRSIDEESKKQVLEIIKKHPEVIKINHFNSTPVGYQYQINLTIFVDGNLTTFASHEIANQLEKEIDEIDNICLTVIHVNPI